MSGKKIVIGDQKVSRLIDEISIANSDSDQLVSSVAYDKVYKNLVNAVNNLKQGQILVINERLAAVLDDLQLIIDANDASLLNIQTDDLSALRAVLARGNAIRLDIANSVAQDDAIEAVSVINDADITYLEQYVGALLIETGYTAVISLAGDVDKFYPIWWSFPTDYVGTVQIKRDSDLTTSYVDPNLTLFFKCRGIGSSVVRYEPQDIRITDFTEKNGVSLRLVSQAVFNTPEFLDPVEHGTYSCPLGNCVFLRGATQYQITCNNAVMLAAIQACANNISPLSIHTINSVNYRVESINETIITSILSDERLKWLFHDQHLVSTVKVNAPIALSVQPDSFTGDYSVTWDMSSTPDVEYVLEQANDELFGNTVELYRGPLRQFDFLDHIPGTFYYRVKAEKIGLASSEWTPVESCAVTKYLDPPTELLLPTVSSRDGEITISWNGSLPVNAYFVVEHATDVNFVDAAILITTTNLSITTSQFPQGDRYFRVKVIKVNYTDSNYFNGIAPVDITIYAHDPTNIVIPAINGSGTFTVNWTATDTPGATYILERSLTNDFSTDVVQIPVTTVSYENTDMLTDTYYFRVKAVLPGVMIDSNWLTGNNGCVVTRTVIAPPNVYVPANNTTGNFMVSWDSSPEEDVTYKLQYSKDPLFGVGEFVEVSIDGTTYSLTDIYPGTWYFRVKAIKPPMYDSIWTNGDNAIAVARTVVTPVTLTVPANDADGILTLTINPSSTPGITAYVVQRSTTSNFSSGVSTVYAGLDLTPTIGVLDPGTYYFRVKGSKTEWIDSAWRDGDVGCVMTRTVIAPLYLTVPASETDDGNTILTIGASSTPGVGSYIVEHSLVSNFSAGVTTMYTGMDLTPPINGLVPGTHYFRVRATKPAWIASGNTNGGNGCVVALTVSAPASVSVPTSDGDGTFNVTIAASSTPGVNFYTLEMSTVANFSSNVSVIYTGMTLTQTINNLVPGTYYFRARCGKTSWITSVYTNGGNGCVIARTVETPISLTVPATDTDDGNIILTRGASSTPGVTAYVFEHSQASDFSSGVTTVYNGINSTPAVNGLLTGMHYFRVKAIRAGWLDSNWRNGNVGCAVSLVGAAPTITVPSSDGDGYFNATIGASSTPSVDYYTVERSLISNFSSGVVTAYTGLSLTPSVASNIDPGTWYYRVKEHKTGWADSGYSAVDNCVVTRTVATPSITVPASDTDGTFTCTIGASSTPGIAAYVVQRSTTSNFSSGVVTVYTGLSLTPSVGSNLDPDTYYYRVKAVKTSWIDSAYSAIDSCVVTRTVATPTYLTVPATDDDGSIPISWGASSTPSVLYTVQRSLVSNFSSGISTVYTGTGLSTTLSGLDSNTHYFRVVASKSSWINSAYRYSGSCVVTLILSGDMAIAMGCSTGGGSAEIGNRVQRMVVSTHASAVHTGYMPFAADAIQMVGCSNGYLDIGCATAGRIAGLSGNENIYKGVISTGANVVYSGALVNYFSNGSGMSSNGSNSIGVHVGGYDTRTSLSQSMVKVVFPALSSSVDSGNIGYKTYAQSQTSNNENDMSVVAGGSDSLRIIRFVTSTSVVTGGVYNLTNIYGVAYRKHPGATSNGTEGMAIFFGGQGGAYGAIMSEIEKRVITTNSNSTVVGHLTVDLYAAEGASNGVLDMGMRVGGGGGGLAFAGTDYMTISTGTSMSSGGNLTIPSGDPAMACNS